MKKLFPAILMWLVFEAVAVTLYLTLGDSFYLANFSYIGTAIAFGLALYARGVRWARNFVQLAVGLYMLVYLGVICRENMQLEGFWYYLFLGVFEAAVIHYAVAKIFGPLLFGRGWCGYACWTAMVLDLLPFKTPVDHERRSFGFVRYILFALSLGFVSALFIFDLPQKGEIMWYAFLAGNAVYYAVGIALAFVLRDNRAFCKYVCPVTVFLKPMSRFSLMRISVDAAKCVDCGKCARSCPMDVGLPAPERRRVNATECILCLKCVEACPQKAITL